MNNISTDELITLLGFKEAELYALRRDNAALRAQLAVLQGAAEQPAEPEGDEGNG